MDVGANIGQYAQFLREVGYSGEIVSLEPPSSAYSQLKTVSSKDSLWKVAPGYQLKAGQVIASKFIVIASTQLQQSFAATSQNQFLGLPKAALREQLNHPKLETLYI